MAVIPMVYGWTGRTLHSCDLFFIGLPLLRCDRDFTGWGSVRGDASLTGWWRSGCKEKRRPDMLGRRCAARKLRGVLQPRAAGVAALVLVIHVEALSQIRFVGSRASCRLVAIRMDIAEASITSDEIAAADALLAGVAVASKASDERGAHDHHAHATWCPRKSSTRVRP